MNAQVPWKAEATIRLAKLTLIIFRGEEPRGSVTFEDNEEEEAATWTEMVQKLNRKPAPEILSEQPRQS